MTPETLIVGAAPTSAEEERVFMVRFRARRQQYARHAARKLRDDRLLHLEPDELIELERVLADGFTAGVEWATKGRVSQVQARAHAWNLRVLRAYAVFKRHNRVYAMRRAARKKAEGS